MFLITFEGNIGAGKTTFLKNFIQFLTDKSISFEFIPEPLEHWEKCKDVDDKNQLELFYENSKTRAFEFQLFSQITRVRKLNSVLCKNRDFFISERSFETGMSIFGEILVDDGFLSTTQHEIISDLTLGCLHNTPQIIKIFLNTPVQTCFERIQNRNRKGEESISLDYLEKIDKKYKELNYDIIITDDFDCETLWNILQCLLNFNQ